MLWIKPQRRPAIEKTGMGPPWFWSEFGILRTVRTTDPGRVQAPEKHLKTFNEVV